jgi:hypothetical protein
MGYYLHHVPGRLRVRIPQLKQRPYRMKKVHEALKDHAGIERIEHRHTTGSVVVRYDPDVLDDTRILSALTHGGLLDETEVIESRREHRRTGDKAGAAVSRIFFSWVMGRVLEANGLSLLAALI